MRKHHRIVWLTAICGMILSCSGCSGKNDKTINAAQTNDTGKAQVIVVKVEKGPIYKAYSAMGTITAANLARVIPKVAGRVAKIYVSEGTPVSAGQTLMQINDAEYRLGVQGYSAVAKLAEVGVAKSERDLARAESLHKEQAIAEREYLDAKSQVEANKYQVEQYQAQAENARKNLSECRVSSPISGIVTSKYVNEGELTAPQSPTPAFIIENMTKVKLEVDLTEDAFNYLQAGDKCLITVDAIPGANFEGIITKIYPSINSISKTFKVTITIDNPGLKLRSGMTARAQIVQKARADAVYAPKAAFLPGEIGYYVFKLQNGKVVKVPVKTGIEGNETYEVTQGLAPGDYVVVEGQVGLSNDLEVKATIAPPNKPASTQVAAPAPAMTAAVPQQKSQAVPTAKK